MTSIQKAWVAPMLYKSRDLPTLIAYCADIRNSLDLAMTRTTDTGQVNIEALSAPTWATAFTLVGYLIYHFTDSLQGTAPIFMRIEFYQGYLSGEGVDNIAGQGQGFLFTQLIFGTGSNGSGTITNPSSTFYCPTSNSYGTSSAEAASRYADRVGVNYMSYNASQGFLFHAYGAIAIYRVGTDNTPLDYLQSLFSIQRTTDDYGNPDARGFVVMGKNEIWNGGLGTAPKTQTYLFGSNTWTTQERTNILSQEVGEALTTYYQTSDLKYLTFPLKYWDPDLGVRSMPGLLYMPTLADSAGAIYSIETIPNRPRRYRSLGPFSQWHPTARGIADYSCLVLWE